MKYTDLRKEVHSVPAVKKINSNNYECSLREIPLHKAGWRHVAMGHINAPGNKIKVTCGLINTL